MLKFDICIIRNRRSHAWIGLRGKCRLDRKGLHSGALSSKTLWELSRDHLYAGRQDRGYIAENIEIDLTHVAHCVDQAISEKMSQLARQLDELSTVREEGANPHGCITFLQGIAHFIDSKTV